MPRFEQYSIPVPVWRGWRGAVSENGKRPQTGSTSAPPKPENRVHVLPAGANRHGADLDRWGAFPHTKLAEDPEGMSHNCGCVYHRHHHGELKISRP